jgi:hypothetical protein
MRPGPIWRAIWLLLLQSHSLLYAAVLANDTYQVPPGEWRSLHFPVTEAPVRLECRFEVLRQPGAARAVLLAREDLERFASHQPYGYLAATGEQSRGVFRFDIRQTGTFAVLLINSSANRAVSPIQFFVSLGPVPAPPGPVVTYLSPRRKLATIVASIAGFLALLTWSVARLLRAMQRHTISTD